MAHKESPPPLVHLVTDEEAKGKAKELFEQMKAKTGAVPKWMRVMASNDDILVGFFTLFKATMDDQPVEAKLKWKMAYAVSEANKCEFCVSVSKQMLASFGMSDQEIGSLDQTANEREKTAMEYAAASTEHAYNIDQELFSRVKQYFSDKEIVELTSVVGLFNFINRFNDSLGVLPDMK